MSTETITRRPIATLPEVREGDVLIYCYPRPYPRPDCAEVSILTPDAVAPVRQRLIEYGYTHWSPLPPLGARVHQPRWGELYRMGTRGSLSPHPA